MIPIDLSNILFQPYNFTHFSCCFLSLKQEVDVTAKVLLAKNGESNGFIREDVEKALAVMLDSITPQRTLLALISGGAM